MCHMGRIICDQAYIFKKERFIRVFEREINQFSLTSTPGGPDDPFNYLIFLSGMLFALPVTWHHNTSLIFHRGSHIEKRSNCQAVYRKHVRVRDASELHSTSEGQEGLLFMQ